MVSLLYSKKARAVHTSIKQRRDLRAAAAAAAVSSSLFLISALLFACGHALGWDAAESNAEARARYHAMETEYLLELWARRRHGAAPLLLADVLAALGWLFMLPAAQSVGAIAGDGFSATRVLNAAMAVGAISASVGLTFEAGMTSATLRLSSWPAFTHANLTHDAAALQSLEIAFVVSRACSSWLVALDDVMLAVGATCAARLAWLSNQAATPRTAAFARAHVHSALHESLTHPLAKRTYVSRRWAALGLINASLALATFAFSVLRAHGDADADVPAAVCNVLLDGVGLPAWLLWLAFQLHAFSATSAKPLSNSRPGSARPPSLIGKRLSLSSELDAADECTSAL